MISVIRLARGSKEDVIAQVNDVTNQITTLVGSSPTFTVKDDAGATKQSGSCGITNNMTLNAVVDTNAGGLWALGHYNLYFSWGVAGEVPIQGPFDLYVV